MRKRPHPVCHSWRRVDLGFDGGSASSSKGRPELLFLLLVRAMNRAGQLKASDERGSQDLHGHIGANNTSLLTVPARVLPAVALNLAPCQTSLAPS